VGKDDGVGGERHRWGRGRRTLRWGKEPSEVEEHRGAGGPYWSCASCVGARLRARAGSTPALDLRPPPIPTPELRPGVTGRRRGRVAEGGHEEGGHRRLALGTPLHCRRREREAAGASTRATRVGWGAGAWLRRGALRAWCGDVAVGKGARNKRIRTASVRPSGRTIGIITVISNKYGDPLAWLCS